MDKLKQLIKLLSGANKFIVALIAALGLLINVMPDGLTIEEVYSVVVGFLGALGVYLVPNSKRGE